MSKVSSFYPVNWIDGMKINKDHFIDQDNAVSYQIRETIGVRTNHYNYGLLPASGENTPVKMWIDMESDKKLHIRILSCRAITFGGYKIDIADRNTNPLEISSDYLNFNIDYKELKENSYFIALSINPFKRIPFGTVNPEEEPLRYPYIAPDYKINLISPSEASQDPGINHLIIGKIKIANNRADLIEDFIPPCTTVNSHSSLIELHGLINSVFSSLEKNAVSILQKIHQKEQNHKLAIGIRSITESLLSYLNNNLYKLRHILKYEAPIHLVETIAIFARTFKNNIDVNHGSGKDELLNYFVEWCNVNQGQFETLVNDVINVEYNHNDIQAGLEKCFKFVKEINTLYQKLNELDFIGRKPEISIIVKEEIKESNQKNKSFWKI